MAAHDPIAGWMLGHHLARGRHSFPGDPWPDGHPGKPSDLAFWGGLLDGDDDDEDLLSEDEDEDPFL